MTEENADRSAVEYVILRDYYDNYAPAERQLSLSMVDDILYLAIEEPGEGDLSERPVAKAEFAINLAVLMGALDFLDNWKTKT